MGQDKRTLARPKPTLPASAPRVLLTAVAESVTVSAETTKLVTLIGSRRDCDLSIGQSDVSKVHCALVNTGTNIVVADLCTRAGTFVNGQPVSIASLCPGDELRVGSEPVAVWFPEPPESSAPSAAGENHPELELQHPLRLEGPERSYELTTLPAVVGRRSTCQVVLDTPDVSLAHALLFAVEGQPAVWDLGSRSGTYLNGQRVGLAWLDDGDVLSIGGERLTLTFRSPAPVPPEGTDHADADPPFSPASDAPAADDRNATLLTGSRPDTAATELGGAPPVARQDRAALDQREAALAEREARLLAAEQELARKQAELAERESSDREAAKRIAEFMGALSEVWQVVGFGYAPGTPHADPNASPAVPPALAAGLGSPTRQETSGLSAGADLPAPLVKEALFHPPKLD